MIVHIFSQKHIKKFLVKIHFLAFAFLISNFLSSLITPYSLINSLEVSLKIILIVSGIILFLLNISPLKQIVIYYAVYTVWVILIPIGYILGGTFWAIVVSLLLHPIWPDSLEVKKDGIAIYDNAQGFMNVCCPYKVTEQKFLFLENCLGEFELVETIDPKTLQIMKTDKDVKLTFLDKFNDLEKEIVLERN